MTNLHAGGKFEQGIQGSGGLHGVGMKCTNALSEWMITTVRRDGGIYNRNTKGAPVAPVEKIGNSEETELNIHLCLMIRYLAPLSLILKLS